MSLFGGIVGAVMLGVPAWLVAHLAAANLPAASALLVVASLAGLAALVGFTVGGAIFRRASMRAAKLRLFAAIAGLVGGGVVGAALALGITGAYLATYGVWPADILGQVLYLLAFPAFAAVGWFVGAAAGFVIGLAGGTFLSVLPLARGQ